MKPEPTKSGKCCQLITETKRPNIVRTCKRNAKWKVRDDGRQLCQYHFEINEKLYGAYK